MRILIRPFPDGVEPLALEADAVHVWQARLDGRDLRDVLTPDEQQRAVRYRHPRTAGQFAAARRLLRTLLGRYLACSPALVPIVTRPDGKPELTDAVQRGLYFNLAHSGDVGVFAVARCEVGVDVEAERAPASADALVQRFFAPMEQEQYQALPAELRGAAFVRGWTGKEAVLKGLGCGTRDLSRCVVDIDPRRPVAIVGPPETSAQWRLTGWSPEQGYVAAIAYEATKEAQG